MLYEMLTVNWRGDKSAFELTKYHPFAGNSCLYLDNYGVQEALCDGWEPISEDGTSVTFKRPVEEVVFNFDQLPINTGLARKALKDIERKVKNGKFTVVR